MSYLPDDMFVAHVSIPGTHDTATAEGWETSTGPSYSTTQNKTLDEQLAGGIRAFDFRPGLTSSKDKLWCNHGIDRTKMTMEDAFNKLTNYLDAHPGEFFVIHLFRGNVYNHTADKPIIGTAFNDTATEEIYNNLFNQFFNEGKFADYIIDYNPRLKVKDVRGKIVVFRRSQIDFANINKAGNLGGWPSDKALWDANVYATAVNASNPAITGVMQVEDISSPNTEELLNVELQSIENLYNYSSTQTVPNDVENPKTYKPFWSMLFTSGAYPSENTAGYLTNATHTNPLFTKLINESEKKGPTGIVFSDWVLTDSHTYSGSTYATMGVDLVKAIWENNFAYAADYILDDEKFTSTPSGEEKVNQFPDGPYFLRNVGTGEYLSAGTTWGTHAALNKNGIRVSFNYDPTEDAYTFSTLTSKFLGWDGSGLYVDWGSGEPLSLKKLGNGKYAFVATLDGKERGLCAEPAEGFRDSNWFVNLPIYNAEDPMQQWEVISEAQMLKAAKQIATEDNPVEVTYMVPGHRFIPNDPGNDKWVISGKGACVNSSLSGVDTSGDKDFLYRIVSERYQSGTSWFRPVYTDPDQSNSKYVVAQTVEGLYPGKYYMTANVVTNNTGVKFIAGGKEADLSKATTTNATLAATAALDLFRGDNATDYVVRIDGIEVGEDGKLEIKVDNNNGANPYAHVFCFDNIELYYMGDGTLPDPEPLTENPFDNEQYLMRNVGTGEYLTSGGTWGTHAVTGKYGARITPLFNEEEGKALLTTTYGAPAYLGIQGEFYMDRPEPISYNIYTRGDGKYYFATDVNGEQMSLTAEAAGVDYADGIKNVVNPRAIEFDNPMHQWEMIPVSSLTKDIKLIATPENPVDLTVLVHGHSILVNDKENDAWVVSGMAAGSLFNPNNAKYEKWGSNNENDKEWVYRHYATSRTNNKFVSTQTVEGLPDGVYTLTANIATSSDAIKFLAGGIEADLSGVKVSNTGMTAEDAVKLFRNENEKYTVTIDNIIVGEDGKLELKIDNANGLSSAYSFALKNVRLYYKGFIPAESKFEADTHYFLRNVGTGKYLRAGSAWGTQATLSDDVDGIRITPEHNNLLDTYKLRTSYSNNGLGYNGDGDFYTDFATVHSFTIDEVSDGVYTLSVNRDGAKEYFTAVVLESGAVTNDYAYTIVRSLPFNEGDEMQHWNMISEAEMVANASQAATKDAPADMTFKIRGHRFDKVDNDTETCWTFENEGVNVSKVKSGLDDNWNKQDFVMHFSSRAASGNAFSFAQTVEGLPDGIYTFTCNYVASSSEIALTVGNQTADVTNSLTANASLSALDAYNLFRTANSASNEEEPAPAARAARDGVAHLVTVNDIEVGPDGKLNIKLANENDTHPAFMAALDNLKLYYLGTKDAVTSVDEVMVSEDEIVEVYNLAGMLVKSNVKASEALRGLDKGFYILRSASASVKVYNK
ncbi:MAG: hypothetical protein K2M93_01665 [Muribaculaceae bacterium]|nr:hypothetical protein [Muribaculaceae bacterium]